MFDGKDCSGLGGVDPQALYADAGGVAKSHMGGIQEDNIVQASSMRRNLLDQILLIWKFLMKLRK